MTTPLARADETQACIDASDRGQVLRIDKHLRDARDQFALCARRECPGEIRESCGRWLSEAQRAIPEIVFVVKDARGNDVSPVHVTIDGARIMENYHGSAMPLDPGEHAFRFETTGKEPLERTFRLVQGERERRETIVFEDPTRAPSAASDVASSVAQPPSSSSGLRTAGLVVGAGGVVGIAVGSVLGVLAITRNASAHCDAKNVCDDPRARLDAQGVARGSTIAFVAGGALLAGGLALYFLAPRGEAAPTVGLVTSLSNRSVGGALEATW